MISINNLTSRQLRKAAVIQDRIDKLQQKLHQILGAPAQAPPPVKTTGSESPKKSRLSPQGVANIRAGVRKRMAKRRRAAAQVKAAA